MALILNGTDGLSDVDGTAATPAIRGTDANTGMFFPAADTIAFSEGGVESMRLNSSGVLVTTNDASINGLTVGKGGGAVSSNTVVGLNAQVATAGGGEVTAIGNNALTNNISTTSLTAVGSNALFSNTTGQVNVGVGKNTLYFNTTGSFNVALGMQALQSNTTASNNTAVGYQAAYSNTTSTNNTAIGYQAGYSGTTSGNNTFVGLQAGYANTAFDNTFVGYQSGAANTTGTNLAALGLFSLLSNTTGSGLTALGRDALRSNTTASNNTAVGYQAGYSNTTGGVTAFGQSALRTNTTGLGNVGLGNSAGYAMASNNYSTYVGHFTGYNTTGGGNTFIGNAGSDGSAGCGFYMTTGANNTIIGGYTGNQGGLDIRTASNYIVLSDGVGNPRMYCTNTGRWVISSSYAGELVTVANSHASTPYGIYNGFTSSAPNNGSQWFHLSEDTGGLRFVVMANGGVKNYSANNVNLSDESVKKDITLAGDYLDKICAIPVKTFLYIDQTDTDLNLGVIAQDVQAVAPELVTTTEWGTKENPETKLSVYEADFMYALMKSIQELNAKVEAQALEIAQLKGN